MYEPDITIITPISNIVDDGLVDDFTILLSLLNMQTYEYIEHIVIDNASNDGTVELLKEYKNSGYLNFYSEPDRGKFDAMNKGLLRAKGKYVAFLSCDDFYHDITGIADVVNLMEAEDADFCFFPSYCRLPEDGGAFLFAPSIYNVFQTMPCPRQAVFFKKSTLQQIGGFDEKFKLLAFHDLMIRLILGGYKGVMFGGNIVTCKIAEQIEKFKTQTEAEMSHIFYQNYKSLYNMTDEVLDRLVKIGEIPKPLLEKLAQSFPKEDKQIFYDRCQAMYELKVRAQKEQKNKQERKPLF